MSRKESSAFWVKTSKGPWGPFDWKLLREWFALRWLPPVTEIATEKDGPWMQAQSVNKLWKETKSIVKQIEDFEIVDLESEKVPLSSALRQRILGLGWPGDLENLRNYYWGNRLREKLESIFPDALRPRFDDPDWPKCWSSPPPARESLEPPKWFSDPITTAQNDLLVFFLGPNHGIEKKIDASIEIEELLDDPDNAARWEAHNSKVPATKRQRDRLDWWAKKMGRSVPLSLKKAQASDLIDKWLDERPDLESEWYEFKAQREAADSDSYSKSSKAGRMLLYFALLLLFGLAISLLVSGND
jgi:hypothetical protein